MRVGQQVVIDGWVRAVVCDTRADGAFFTVHGDNHRQRFDAGDPRVVAAPTP